MTFIEFDTYSNKLLAEVFNMRKTKGREYANGKDRFDNFNRLAQRLRLPREKVWQVYFTKHLDAIESFIDRGRTFSTESIQGRIIDAITYLTLLGGMLKENEKSSNRTKNKTTISKLRTPLRPVWVGKKHRPADAKRHSKQA